MLRDGLVGSGWRSACGGGKDPASQCGGDSRRHERRAHTKRMLEEFGLEIGRPRTDGRKIWRNRPDGSLIEPEKRHVLRKRPENGSR